MNKLTVLILLAVGMMVVSCKKDEPVTPSPTTNTGTVSIRFKTPLISIIMADQKVYEKNSGFNIIDSTIVYSNIKDSTRFDVVIFYEKDYPAELEVLYNGVTVFDTVAINNTKTDGFSLSYFANKYYFVAK